MNITQENRDELNSVIKIQIEPQDYQQKLEEVLKDYRKKAKLDGFRPGKAPMGIVKKLYGTSALLDQVNQLLGEGLSNHIVENELRIMGEPLPSEDSPDIDWEKQTSFEFSFDIAMAPDVDLDPGKLDNIVQYVIEADDKIIDEQVENFCQRFGSYLPVETAEENDLLKGDFIQLDDKGEPITDGIRAEDALISVSTIGDEESKKLFIGAQANQDIIIDALKAFPNDADRAAMFKMKKDEADQIKGQFKFTISEVSRFTKAELDQKLFDSTYGEGVITSVEEYRDRMKKDLEMQFSNESAYKFHIDVRERLLNEAGFELPDEFLKRWMLATTKDEDLTKEKIEEEYPAFREDLRWQLIKDKFIKEQSIEAEKEEILAFAIQDARNRFRQYGMYDVPEDQLKGLAESILSNKDEERRMVEQIQENKVITFVKETVKVEDKKISLDGFKKLFE